MDEELTGNDEVIYGAEEDEAMAQFVPTGVESAQEAAVRRARIAERPGTEAEWEELVASGEIAEVPPIPEVPDEFARPPRGERVRPLPKPVAPTRRERELHELSHYPYVSWCRHCVKGKACNDPHRKLKNHAWRESEPVVSGDFCFFGQSEDNDTAPVFVLRDHRSRLTFAHVVQGKSTNRSVYSQPRQLLRTSTP